MFMLQYVCHTYIRVYNPHSCNENNNHAHKITLQEATHTHTKHTIYNKYINKNQPTHTGGRTAPHSRQNAQRRYFDGKIWRRSRRGACFALDQQSSTGNVCMCVSRINVCFVREVCVLMWILAAVCF